MTIAPELAIRMRRAVFNRAIVDADLTAIAPVLAPDVVLVAGTDSAVIAGRKAQLATWKREFASRDRAVYVRTPSEIVVSPIHPIAFEHGEWQGLAAAGGVVIASGPYTAKWRQIGEDWVIEAELYLTTACSDGQAEAISDGDDGGRLREDDRAYRSALHALLAHRRRPWRRQDRDLLGPCEVAEGGDRQEGGDRGSRARQRSG